MYTCVYCGKVFKKKSNLTRHQRTAKYCLEKQVVIEEEPVFKCHHCNKEFCREDSLARHIKKYCSSNETESEEKDTIKIFEKLLEMVQKNQNANATQTNALMEKMITMLDRKDASRKNPAEKLQPITNEDLLAYLDNLSLNFITRGAQGYADYAGNYPFKGKLICTDRSRKKIQYKNEDGSITADGNALAQRFFAAILEKNTAIINNEYAELQKKLENIVANNSAHVDNVSDILKRASFIQEMLIKTQNAAAGEDSEFTQTFLHYLSKTI